MARLNRALRESEERDVDHISLNVDESDLRAVLARLDAAERDVRRLDTLRERIARRVARIGDQYFEWDEGTDEDRAWAYRVADDCLFDAAMREGVGNGE